MWSFATALGLLSLLGALGPACDDHLIGRSGPIGSTCLRDPPLTYENFGDGLLSRHCRSCHSVAVRQELRGGAPLGIDFDTWDEVLEWADQIDFTAVQENTMPPAATMLQVERDKLGEWLRCEVMPALGEVNVGTTPGGT
ncbi:MAG: hypothetical protein ABMB14_20170 [Myxococcota bacterium]